MRMHWADGETALRPACIETELNRWWHMFAAFSSSPGKAGIMNEETWPYTKTISISTLIDITLALDS